MNKNAATRLTAALIGLALEGLDALAAEGLSPVLVVPEAKTSARSRSFTIRLTKNGRPNHDENDLKVARDTMAALMRKRNAQQSAQVSRRGMKFSA